MDTSTVPQKKLNACICTHCGDSCSTESAIYYNDLPFCCSGCQAVYELLQNNELCQYYSFENSPGIKIQIPSDDKYAYLDSEEVIQQIVQFREGGYMRHTFYIPSIHCSSCVWLLENLHKLNPGIISSRVNFLKKEVNISWQEKQISFRSVVELLAKIGYTPNIEFRKNTSPKKSEQSHRELYTKLAVAGFCAGNIMLLSFPEYLGIDKIVDKEFIKLFGYINILLSLPVFFYCCSDYFRSAWYALKTYSINIDVPISSGFISIFTKSIYDILTHSGSGYLDSFSGLVFFLFIGKWYQRKTYDAISFSRDYSSYFPVAALKIEDNSERYVPIQHLKKGDEIRVHHNEVIPADGILLEGNASIDYSFVTGESKIIQKQKNDTLYAGGRQMGTNIRVKLLSNVSQSRFLQLWNQDIFSKQQYVGLSKVADSFAKPFTITVLLVAIITTIYWWFTDIDMLLKAVVSVLVVACPCALALSAPFTLGNALARLGNVGIFLKNANVVELLAYVDTIVFDKTGTLTTRDHSTVEYKGIPLSNDDLVYIKSTVVHSAHPLSMLLCEHLNTVNTIPIQQYEEVTSKGIEAKINDVCVKIGSQEFVCDTSDNTTNETCIYISIGENVKGYFSLTNLYRKGMDKLIKELSKKYSLHVLSGDNESERKYLESLFPEKDNIHFFQTPESKYTYVKKLMEQGNNVMMIGDGLNDAAALKQANIGLTVVDDIHSFTPACDGILKANRLQYLHALLQFAQNSKKIISFSIGFSIVYNIVGISFAVQGAFSPLVAAIMMPTSSVLVVSLCTLGVWWYWQKFRKSIFNNISDLDENLSLLSNSI